MSDTTAGAPEGIAGFGEVLTVVSKIAEGGVVGVLMLVLALKAKGVLDDADIKLVADAVTRKIPEENLASPHNLFRDLLPGYQPSDPQI